MSILTKEQFLKQKGAYLKKIKKGAVFIYPTDTVYGIGCSALITSAVKRIRAIKQRSTTPFSVAAPSKKWILENCVVHDKKILAKLPGKYTLVLPLKNKKAVSREVAKGHSSLGVRIPDNWFSKIIAELGVPIVTTSANIHGQPNMKSLNDLNGAVKESVDFIVYEGKKAGRPSTIIDLTSGTLRVRKR